MNFPLNLLTDNVLKQIVNKTTVKTRCRLRKSHKRIDNLFWFSRSITNFPLSSFPDKVLKQILEKTSFTTLCRLRRSQKKLDIFVEENRFSIRAVADAEYDEEEVFVQGRIMRFISPRQFEIHFCISTQAIYFTIERNTFNGRRIYEVSPKSLSAVYFKKVTIHIADYGAERHPTSPNDIYSPEDLKEMHYSCEKLILYAYHCGIDEEIMEKLIAPFKFSYLSLHTSSTPFRFMHNPVIQNCKEVNVNTFVEIPKNISSVLRYAQVRKLELHGYLSNPQAFVNSILEELKEDSGAIGNLENISLSIYHDKFDCFSQCLLWKGHVASHMCYEVDDITLCKSDHFFYVVEVCGGIVFMNNGSFDFNMTFIKGNVWMKLISRILEILTRWMPCDCSSIWDEFMNTTDLPGTIEKVLTSFKADYLFEPVTP